MSVPPSFRPSPFAWTTLLVGSDEGDPEKALVGVGTTRTRTATISVSLGHSTVEKNETINQMDWTCIPPFPLISNGEVARYVINVKNH